MKNKKNTIKIGGYSVFITFILLFILLMNAFAISQALCAEKKYPIKPVKLVVPFGTGGATDIAARGLAGPIHEFLGQPVVVVNLPGAGGAVGFDDVRKSEPDGYKLMMAAIGANALVPALNTKLHFRYDELVFIARTQIDPNALVVNAKSPWKTFKEFIEALKSNPGKYTFSTAGIGQVSHVGPILMLNGIGLKGSDATSIHFNSDGEAILAVVRGDTDFYQGNLNAIMGSLKGGLVRCLAVTTPQRVEVIKDIPTYTELGYPQINIVGWRGICGPPKLHDYVVSTWEEAVYKTLKSETWLKMAEKLGDIPSYMNSKEFTNFLHEEYKRYRKLFTELGILIK